MINIILQDDGSYKVEYDNGVYMGDLSRDHDLLFNFWPKHPSTGGFWPSHILRSIIEKLDELNKPIEAEFDEWCRQEDEFHKNDPMGNDALGIEDGNIVSFD